MSDNDNEETTVTTAQDVESDVGEPTVSSELSAVADNTDTVSDAEGDAGGNDASPEGGSDVESGDESEKLSIDGSEKLSIVSNLSEVSDLEEEQNDKGEDCGIFDGNPEDWDVVDEIEKDEGNISLIEDAEAISSDDDIMGGNEDNEEDGEISDEYDAYIIDDDNASEISSVGDSAPFGFIVKPIGGDQAVKTDFQPSEEVNHDEDGSKQMHLVNGEYKFDFTESQLTGTKQNGEVTDENMEDRSSPSAITADVVEKEESTEDTNITGEADASETNELTHSNDGEDSDVIQSPGDPRKAGSVEPEHSNKQAATESEESQKSEATELEEKTQESTEPESTTEPSAEPESTTEPSAEPESTTEASTEPENSEMQEPEEDKKSGSTEQQEMKKEGSTEPLESKAGVPGLYKQYTFIPSDNSVRAHIPPNHLIPLYTVMRCACDADTQVERDGHLGYATYLLQEIINHGNRDTYPAHREVEMKLEQGEIKIEETKKIKAVYNSYLKTTESNSYGKKRGVQDFKKEPRKRMKVEEDVDKSAQYQTSSIKLCHEFQRDLCRELDHHDSNEKRPRPLHHYCSYCRDNLYQLKQHPRAKCTNLIKRDDVIKIPCREFNLGRCSFTGDHMPSNCLVERMYIHVCSTCYKRKNVLVGRQMLHPANRCRNNNKTFGNHVKPLMSEGKAKRYL